jgi:hypothetical protein
MISSGMERASALFRTFSFMGDGVEVTRVGPVTRREVEEICGHHVTGFHRKRGAVVRGLQTVLLSIG